MKDFRCNLSKRKHEREKRKETGIEQKKMYHVPFILL